MRIDNIISRIEEEQGHRKFYSFETFILNLLENHLTNQSKELETFPYSNMLGDGYAPNGLDDYSKPILFEIKFELRRIPPRLLIDRFFRKVLENANIKEIGKVIIITAKPTPEKYKKFLFEKIKSLDLPFEIEIWEPEEINKLVNKNLKKVNEIISNLFSLRIASAVNKNTKDWKEERKQLIIKLKEHYLNGQFSLFLGAGVSSSAGMPDWNTLLNSLFVTYLTKEFDENKNSSDKDISELVDRLNYIDEPSALMAARYLRKGLTSGIKSKSSEFRETISENLYSLRNKKRKIDSELITTIGKLCSPKRRGANVRSVITYNFDDLIERQLKSQDIEYHSIYTDDEVYSLDELPIYHVHGFLPENTLNYASLEKSTLVFSEEGYHEIYSNSYHWSNLVQLNNLRENNCLMIGLSMTDPNLRRLLDISSSNSEKTRHFSFMKRLSLNEFTYEKGIQVINDLEIAETFLERHHNLNEEIMRELGVSIIWYESYDDIPEILLQLLSK